MKRIIVLILSVLIILNCTGCMKRIDANGPEPQVEIEEEIDANGTEPQIDPTEEIIIEKLI